MLKPYQRFSDILPARAAAEPDSIAVIFGDLRLSYAELDHQVDRWARALVACGVAKGDRVATLSTPRPEYLFSYLAAVRIGAIWVGLNPVQQLDEYRQVLSDSKPRLLFALDSFRSRDNAEILVAIRAELPQLFGIVVFGKPPQGCIPLADFLALGHGPAGEAVRALTAEVEPDDVALLVYTSGTTGRPKGAMLTQRNVAFGAALYSWRWPVAPLRAICNLPISHIACSTETVAFVLASGGTLVFQEYFDPEAFLLTIEKYRITWIIILPTMLQRILQIEGWEGFDKSSLEAVVFGGASMSADMIDELHKFCHYVFTLWGLTESTVGVTFTDPGDSIEVLTKSIGRAGPDCEIAIRTEPGAAPSDAGEIIVRGPSVFAGYFGMPGETAAIVDKDGWLRSGDLGRLDAEGRFFIVGRIKEMFKSGGYNIYPREVEAVIEQHPAVAICVVIPVPDPMYQEVGVAFICPASGHDVAPDEIAKHCRDKLANYKIPKRIVILRDLPMLPIGKIDKVELRRRAQT